MHKIIFFSGTHGVGKTTTINSASKKFKIPIFQAIGDDHQNPIKENVFRRQAYRLGKYFSDALHLEDLTENSKKHIFADRCIYDWLAYTETFKKVGWITAKEYKKLMEYKDSLFDKNLMPKNIVWFDPPFEWSRERILSRWNEEKKKWKEDDFEYLKTLRDIYKKIYSSSKINVLHLESLDIEERVKLIGKFARQIK